MRDARELVRYARGMKKLGVVVGMLVVVAAAWLVMESSSADVDVDLVGPAPEEVVAGDAVVAPEAAGDAAEVELVVPQGTELVAETVPLAARDAHGRVVGTVVMNASDESVAGATVVVRTRDGDTFRGETDSLGAFAVEVTRSTPTRLAFVEVLHGPTWPQALKWARTTLEPGGEVVVDVRVPRTIVVTGTVVDLEDRPVSGALVRGWSVSPGRVSGGTSADPGITVETDATGGFRVDGVGPTFTLTATAGDLVGHSTAASDRDLGLDVIDGIRLVVSAARTIQGRVVDAAGAPVENANVEVLLDRWFVPAPSERLRPRGPLAATATSDHEGAFSFERIASRELDVVVEAEGQPKWTGTHSPGDGVLNVQLAAGGAVSGRVIGADGTPVPGAEVLYVTAGWASRRTCETDADGAFALHGLAETDEGILGVVADGHAVLVRDELRIDPKRSLPPFEIELAPARRLSGIVVDAAGAPLEDVHVTIEGENVLEQFNQDPLVTWEYLLVPTTVRTEADGRFAFDHLNEGVYLVTLEAPGGNGERRDVEVVAGDEDLRFVLDPSVPMGVVFGGRVTDALTGAPIPEFSVAVFAGGEGSARMFARADPEGRYQLGGYLPGEMFLSFRSDDYGSFQSEERVFDVGHHVVDAILLPHRELRLRVVDLSGSPVAGARVKFKKGERSIYVPAASAESRTSWLDTDADGEVHARGLPATTITVTAEHREQGTFAERTFDLTTPQVGIDELVLGEREKVELVNLTVWVFARGSADPLEFDWPSMSDENFATYFSEQMASGAIAAPVESTMHLTVRQRDGNEIRQMTVTQGEVSASAFPVVPLMTLMSIPAEPLSVSVKMGDKESSTDWDPSEAVDGLGLLIFTL